MAGDLTLTRIQTPRRAVVVEKNGPNSGAPSPTHAESVDAKLPPCVGFGHIRAGKIRTGDVDRSIESNRA